MSNRLIRETSPYLLQHADNPVDWYPWGNEAFDRAKREDKPVFVSIGYSTCHWCHVMAHESFEDEAIAAILNEHFISVKVDREERPDIDSVYMTVLQAFTGSGGWPASLFLTPGQKPFYAGTYYPPRSRHGMPGFGELLRAIADRWENAREELLRSAEEILLHLREGEAEEGDIDPSLPAAAVKRFSRSFDASNGGFGDAPKFPAPHNLLFLLAYSRITGDRRAAGMAETTLTQMRKGGIFDQIGYGFSRYSTDRFYLAPHFEKMLYDNALLIPAYAAAYTATGKPHFLDTAEKTAAYVLRELAAPEGGFYAAQDADSDGAEGEFYLFSREEAPAVLGESMGRRFNDYYGITPEGNFEGRNIPNRLHADEAGNSFDWALPTLCEYRRKRRKLHLDDKILTSWNAMMIGALACLYRASGKREYLDSAQKARQCMEKHLADGDRLFVSYRDGRRTVNGFLDDYAYYAAALLELYEASGDPACLDRAKGLCGRAMKLFADEAGGFSLSGRDNERLVLQPKETYDGAIPSGNSVMAYVLVKLSQLTHDGEWERAARKQLAFLSGEAAAYPAGHGLFLLSLLLYLNPPPDITVVLGEGEKRDEAVKRLPLYAHITILDGPEGTYTLLNGQTTFYVCRGRTCLPPANTLESAI